MERNIYIYGVTNSDNKGDNVICDTFSLLVNRYAPNCKIELRNISYSPILWKCIKRILNYFHVDTLRLDKIVSERYLFKKNKNNDIIVFAGGQLFYEYFVDYIKRIITGANNKNINVYFYGCGTGIMSEDSKIKLIEVLKSESIKEINLRDDYINLREKVKTMNIVPDVAILSDLLLDRIGNKRNVVGIGIIDISNYNKQNEIKISKEQYINYISALVNIINKKGFDVELFCNGHKYDYQLSKLVYERLKDECNIYLASCPTSSLELVRLMSFYRYVIASRLHALIISYALDIPFWGLSWDLKIPAFCKMIGTFNNFNNLGEFDCQKFLGLFSIEYDKNIKDNLRNEVIYKINNILKL